MINKVIKISFFYLKSIEKYFIRNSHSYFKKLILNLLIVINRIVSYNTILLISNKQLLGLNSEV